MDDVEALLGGEPGDGLPLGFEAEAALTLPRGGLHIGDGVSHGSGSLKHPDDR
jgi:hypothetical protein